MRLVTTGDFDSQIALRASPSLGRIEIAMTNAEQKREVLRALADLVEHTPDIRFGQLIANLSVITSGPTPEAVRDLEDDELPQAVKSHLEDDERRNVEVA